jgi:oxygen-independent coproporphyrinogen-3 oxidase
MREIDTLRRYGLFAARVPRYSSYPPANHFVDGAGLRNQQNWLHSVADGTDVSLYVHIPFCKRLCWFCACRTQSTQTMPPVDAYVALLRREIRAVRARLPTGIRMSRLHLGGGTPTILSPVTMADLLREVFTAFKPALGFEFSVEIDPTDAATPLLQTLVDFGLTRASIGVQDFDTRVQNAIGCHQTLDQTRDLVRVLRAKGVRSLGVDVLYGLPQQTPDSFSQTLHHVLGLAPDRLALYGYAHVPWMSKRQHMINENDLPDTLARLALCARADAIFAGSRYLPVGIDHFALPSDSLSHAAQDGRLHRNFQGYTDDPAPVLLGFGASAISRFPQGYSQNASATLAYEERIEASGLAAHKGFQMREEDLLMARMIEDLMCRFAFDERALTQAYPRHCAFIHATAVLLMQQFPEVFHISGNGLQLDHDAYPLVRVIAGFIDRRSGGEIAAHSYAI